jgi:hypothetical protein
MANKKLATTITIGGTVTSGLRAAVGSTQSMLRGLGKSVQDLTKRQKLLGESINVFGRMGKNVDGLRQRYQETIATVDRLRAAQKRLADQQARADRIQTRAGAVARAGAGASVAGGALLAAAVPGVKEAKHYQNEENRITALGMGDKTNAAAFEFAKGLKTYGTSQLENLELLRDGMSVFADLHHAEMVTPLLAKMKFGNKAVFGAERGEQQSQQFMDMLKVIETRGGLKSEAEFSKQANIIQQVISATGGRVSATEWRHMLMTGGLAGKSMDSEALFYTFEHLVQEMGGDRAGTGLNSMYKSLYQGVAKKRSVLNLERFGLIGDKTKVKHDKAGQVSSMEPGALKDSDLFRANPFEWMEKTLLPQLAKHGITEEKQIIDTIGMIVSNSVGGSFLAEMYRQRENIHRARDRNKGAQNVDQLYDQGKNSAAGKELDAEAKLADLKLKLGQEVLPIYTKALEVATGALVKFNAFAEKNPGVTKALVVGATVLGGALVTLGPVLVATAGAMGIYAGAQMMLARATAAGALSGGISLLGRAMTGLAGVIPGLLSVVRPLALAFAIAGAPMWVVAAAAAAIGVAGLAIYKYWEPLKAFFVGFGEGLMAGMQPFIDVVKPVVMPILETLGGWVKSAAGWFGDLLTPIGAASETTKKFGDAGKLCGEVVAKAFNVMLTPIKAVVSSIEWLVDNAGKVRGLFGGSSTPSLPAPAPQSLPAVPQMRGATGAAGGQSVTQTNTFHITQQPGQDAKQLADQVAERLKRQNDVRNRSAMGDR